MSTVAGGAVSSSNSNVYGTSASFNFPLGLTVDNSGQIFIADYGAKAIKIISPLGHIH